MYIAHVGIAVNDLEAAVAKYEELLGVKAEYEEAPGMVTAILATESGKLELLYSDDPGTAVGKFLAKNGEGLHHVAMEVDDVAKYLAKADSMGIRLIDKAPRPGGEDKQIAFLHPKDMHGVLFEFCMD